MILAAYIVSGFSVASFYAWQLLRDGSSSRVSDALSHTTTEQKTRYNQIAMSLGLILGAICMPPQIAVGDWSAKVVAKTQPIKLAAMESHFRTESSASLIIGGFPDMENQTVNYGIKIPKLLSFLAFGDLNAEVKGLEEFPADEIPPVPVVHVAFQLMVGTGTLLMIYSLLAFVRWLRCRKVKPQTLDSRRAAFFKPRWFLWFTTLTGPLAIIALETGWTVTEVGRQPWIVYGIMRTKDAVTDAPGINLIFFSTLLIYAILFIGSISVLRFLARKPIEQ